MTFNTRFNPTASGDSTEGILHIGHACVAYLNSELAHNSGGEFILRFDNNQQAWIHELGIRRIQQNCDQMLREMEWLGIEVDSVVYHSKEERIVRSELEFHGLTDLLEPDPVTGYEHIPVLLSDSAPQYPYAPWLTAEVVVLDYIDNINLVVLGEELMGRFSLYCNVCDRMGYPVPRQVHVPRLKDKKNSELANISKTTGNHKLKLYKDFDHWGPKEFKEFTADCYLTDPSKGWTLDNVKAEPIIIA